MVPSDNYLGQHMCQLHILSTLTLMLPWFFPFFCRAENFCLADLCLEGKGGRGGKEASHLRFIAAIRIVTIFSVVKEDFIRARIHPVCMFAYKSKHHSKPLIWMALHFCIFSRTQKKYGQTYQKYLRFILPFFIILSVHLSVFEEFVVRP